MPNKENNQNKNTPSLTVGYVENEFLIATYKVSDHFYFMGETFTSFEIFSGFPSVFMFLFV